MENKVQVRDLIEMLQRHSPHAYIDFAISDDENAFTIPEQVGSSNLTLLIGHFPPSEDDLQEEHDIGFREGYEQCKTEAKSAIQKLEVKFEN